VKNPGYVIVVIVFSGEDKDVESRAEGSAVS